MQPSLIDFRIAESMFYHLNEIKIFLEKFVFIEVSFSLYISFHFQHKP